MSVLFRGMQALSPPVAQNAPREYDGFELFRWKMFVFRPAEFKFEGYMLLLLTSYLALYFIGKAINGRRSREVYAPYDAFIRSQFSSVRPVLASSPALYLLYASGRRNVLSLHATLKLFPLHDVLMAVWNTAWAIIEPTTDSSESLEFDVTLGSGSAGLQDGVGVWGVIDKGLMHSIRKTRYDMTFPRMHESATMPITHALYAEHSDTTDALLKTPNVGITDLLAQPAATKILKFFIVTDQPARKPLRGALPADRRTRRVCVGLHKPSSTDDAAAAQAWLQVALNVADLLSRPVLKPDVSRKLAKTRAEVDAALDAEYKKEQDEDAGVKPVTAEDKAADKKAARKRGMSEKELKKQEELERKREMRKMQKRNAK